MKNDYFQCICFKALVPLSFRSHASTCAGEESSLGLVCDGGGGSTEHALAMVLWCNTIRRMIQQSRVRVDDGGEARIMSRIPSD